MSSVSKPAIIPKPRPKPRVLSSKSSTEGQDHDPPELRTCNDAAARDVSRDSAMHEEKVIKVNDAETRRQKGEETATPVVQNDDDIVNLGAKLKVKPKARTNTRQSSSSLHSEKEPNDKVLNLDSKGKLSTFDIREDEEQLEKLDEMIELLVAAGYFRARIKGLSAFDKVSQYLVFT